MKLPSRMAILSTVFGLTMRNKTVAAATLGCKVNAYDTESILELFKNAGYTVTDFAEPADVYIVSTCTVTATGDKKSRRLIRRAAGRGGLVVVAGCLAQSKSEDVSGIEGVNIVIGINERAEIVDIVEKYTMTSGITKVFVGHNSSNTFENMPAAGISGKTRAFVKIQDGCDNYCSYCIIPHIRGRARSRRISDIVNEISSLIGVKEIVLTGISVASYGIDTKEAALADVIRAAADVKNVERIRLSSIGPGAVTEELLAAFRDIDKLCGHVHLSLQSGCDKTLGDMNRNYSTAKYTKNANALRVVRPDIAITTDIITGFPGETDEDFNESLALVEEIGFAALHVFPFSAREGTKAADMPNQIPKNVKAERAARMTELGRRHRADFIRGNIGKTMPVLFESRNKAGEYKGYTPNYIRVSVMVGEDLRGQIKRVYMESVGGAGIYGTIC